jgi:integrase
MRVPHYLVRRESGGFQFRKRIPPRLRILFGGRKDFRQSLRTHCMDTAKAKATILSLRYDAFFSSLDANMANPSIHDFPHLLKADAVVKKYEIQLPDGTKIVAKDAEDHARVMELMKAKSVHDLDMETLRLAKAEAEAKANAANLAAAKAEAAEIAKAVQANQPTASFKRLKMAESKRLYEEGMATLNEKDRKQHLKIVADFAEHAKIEYIDDISRPLVNAWITYLRDKVGNGNTTIKNKVEYRLKQFIEWAMGAGYYPKGDNPAVGHKAITKRSKDSLVAGDEGDEDAVSPFTLTEVANIMEPQNLRRFKQTQDTIWAMLLGVYTGARVSEIGQLYLNDIFQDKDGVWAIRIDVKNPHQSVKTQSSKRKIPIHPTLIKMGLLERVNALQAQKQLLLFPASNLRAQNGAGAVISTRFGRYWKKLKMPDTKGRKLGFRSLRTTFIHEVGQTDFDNDRRKRFVGHEVAGVDFDSYLKFFRPSVLLKDLKKFWNPQIDTVGIVGLLTELGPLEPIKRQERSRAKPTPKAKTRDE